MADKPNLAVMSKRDCKLSLGMIPHVFLPFFLKDQLFGFRTFYLIEFHPVLYHFSCVDHVQEIVIGIPYHSVIIGCFQGVEEHLVQLLINHWRLNLYHQIPLFMGIFSECFSGFLYHIL